MSENDAQVRVSHMFNEIAGRYDQVNRVLSFGIDRRWRKLMAQHLPKKSGLRLLDLATGTCDQLTTLMDSGRVEEAVGIDLAEEMLEIGRKKVEQTPYRDRVELKVASALAIPAGDASFDCVTISFGIRNVQGNCLQEIYRVLAPGGKALILEFSLPQNRIVRGMHLFYLRKVLPGVGGWISRKKSAYQYLNQTIEAFPYGEKFLKMMEAEGFIQVHAIPLTMGVATLYVGEKP